MADEAQGDLLTGASQTETTSNWYSDENKDVVERCGWKGPNDAIQSYRNQEKMSSGMAKMPTPESSAEEIRAFYQKTGCPENPEGYDVVVPETLPGDFRDESIENYDRQALYDGGASKQLGENLIKGYYEKLATDLSAAKEVGEKALREKFADKYDENVEIANRFFDTCTPEFCSLVKLSGLASNSIFIEEFFNKGKQTMADTLIKGDGGGDGGKGEGEYTPKYPNSPEQYATMEGEEGKKARAWHEARGHKY